MSCGPRRSRLGIGPRRMPRSARNWRTTAMTLEELGWAAPFKTALERIGDDQLAPARVSVAHQEHYRLFCADGVYDAGLGGRLRHDAGPGELPAAGDWVAARLRPAERRATI